MDIDFLVKLAENSPGVILTFLALYLFKVVVNDIKHDVESMKLFMQNIDKTLDRIAGALERDRNGRNS